MRSGELGRHNPVEEQYPRVQEATALSALFGVPRPDSGYSHLVRSPTVLQTAMPTTNNAVTIRKAIAA